MTVERFGCVECGERRREIKSVVGKARRAEWLGHPVTDARDRITRLRAEIAECTAGGHGVTEPLRRASGERETTHSEVVA